MNEMKRSKRTFLTSLLSVLMILALGFGVVGCTKAATSEDVQAANRGGTLLVRVNPEIAVHYDRDGRVVGLEGRNNDGQAIMKLTEHVLGMPSREAVYILVAAIHSAGYLVDDVEGKANAITIEIEEGSNLPDPEFMSEIVADVRTYIQEIGVEGQVNGDLVDDSNYDGTMTDPSSSDDSNYDVTESSEPVVTPTSSDDSNYDDSSYGETSAIETSPTSSDYDDSDYDKVTETTQATTPATTKDDSDYDDSDYAKATTRATTKPTTKATTKDDSDYDDSDYAKATTKAPTPTTTKAPTPTTTKAPTPTTTKAPTPTTQDDSDYDDSDYDDSDYDDSDYDDSDYN